MTLALIDTSAWMRRAQPAVGATIGDAVDGNTAVVIVPIILELLRSARDSRELKELGDEYNELHQVDLTRPIGRRARTVQRALGLRGYHRGPSPTDLLAAAAAEAVGAELWHCDRHFELIAEVTGQPTERLGR